jgi:hypothetical protein
VAAHTCLYGRDLPERGGGHGASTARGLRLLAARQTVKALLDEMAIEGEGGVDARTAGGFEAHTVDEAEFSAPGGQKCGDGRGVKLRIDPADREARGDVALKGGERLQAEAVLHKGDGLEEDVVGAKKRRVSAEERLPGFPRRCVVGVVGVEEGGGIDEDGYWP